MNEERRADQVDEGAQVKAECVAEQLYVDEEAS